MEAREPPKTILTGHFWNALRKDHAEIACTSKIVEHIVLLRDFDIIIPYSALIDCYFVTIGA